MYHIYSQKRVLIICDDDQYVPSDSNAVVHCHGTHQSISEAAKLFFEGDKISSLVIITDKIDDIFSLICSGFTEINAGGGIITNEQGEYLMIIRDGLWDLPKGKQEVGEKIPDTALREVQEECGISRPTLGNLCCVTHHVYHRNGLFMLKHTHWFKMSYSSDAALHPQVEEHITEAHWITPDRLSSCLENTYPSIREIFAKKE